MSTGTVKIIYTIVERKDGKKLWLRIGTAFTNRDGSLTCHLDALPVNGSMHIRDLKTIDESQGQEST